MATQDGLYSGTRIGADLPCPGDEPLSIPLDKLFMIFRHMSFYRAVLPGLSVQPRMRADPMILVERLDGSSRHSNIDAMLNVLVRNGVVHFLYAYMIIELDRGGLPNRHFIGVAGKASRNGFSSAVNTLSLLPSFFWNGFAFKTSSFS